MNYRGRYIEDEISNEIETLEFEIEGGNSEFGEITISKKEFNKIVDKFIKLREKINNTTDKDVNVYLDVCEGYYEDGGERIEQPCLISVYTKETVHEKPEEKKKRIEEEKRKIDEEFALSENADKKRKEKYIKGIIKELTDLGYEVKKV